MKAVKEICKGRIFCILGSTIDREIDTEFMSVFSNTELHFCTFKNKRSKSKKDWEIINSICNTEVPIETNVNNAFNNISHIMTSKDLLIVTGSFFLLSDLNLQPKHKT